MGRQCREIDFCFISTSVDVLNTVVTAGDRRAASYVEETAADFFIEIDLHTSDIQIPGSQAVTQITFET